MKLAIVALITVILPCAYGQHGNTTQVDDTFNGRQVVLQVGDVLKITLPENGSTGYQWFIPPELKRKFAKTIRERDQAVEAPDGPPGKAGKRHLFFEAFSAGSGEVELHYRRSWERDTPPARKFRVRTLVKRSPGS